MKAVEMQAQQLLGSIVVFLGGAPPLALAVYTTATVLQGQGGKEPKRLWGAWGAQDLFTNLNVPKDWRCSTQQHYQTLIGIRLHKSSLWPVTWLTTA